MFIDPNEKVPVQDEKGNTINIRPKMNIAQKGRATDALLSVTVRSADQVGDTQTDTDFTLGESNTALLEINIVSWEGPSFRGVKCTPANIRNLDPDEPIVDLVLAEINRRNNTKPADATDPKLPTSAGDAS